MYPRLPFTNVQCPSPTFNVLPGKNFPRLDEAQGTAGVGADPLRAALDDDRARDKCFVSRDRGFRCCYLRGLEGCPQLVCAGIVGSSCCARTEIQAEEERRARIRDKLNCVADKRILQQARKKTAEEDARAALVERLAPTVRGRKKPKNVRWVVSSGDCAIHRVELYPSREAGSRNDGSTRAQSQVVEPHLGPSVPFLLHWPGIAEKNIPGTGPRGATVEVDRAILHCEIDPEKNFDQDIVLLDGGLRWFVGEIKTVQKERRKLARELAVKEVVEVLCRRAKESVKGEAGDRVKTEFGTFPLWSVQDVQQNAAKFETQLLQAVRRLERGDGVTGGTAGLRGGTVVTSPPGAEDGRGSRPSSLKPVPLWTENGDRPGGGSSSWPRRKNGMPKKPATASSRKNAALPTSKKPVPKPNRLAKPRCIPDQQETRALRKKRNRVRKPKTKDSYLAEVQSLQKEFPRLKEDKRIYELALEKLDEQVIENDFRYRPLVRKFLYDWELNEAGKGQAMLLAREGDDPNNVCIRRVVPQKFLLESWAVAKSRCGRILQGEAYDYPGVARNGGECGAGKTAMDFQSDDEEAIYLEKGGGGAIDKASVGFLEPMFEKRAADEEKRGERRAAGERGACSRRTTKKGRKWRFGRKWALLGERATASGSCPTRPSIVRRGRNTEEPFWTTSKHCWLSLSNTSSRSCYTVRSLLQECRDDRTIISTLFLSRGPLQIIIMR